MPLALLADKRGYKVIGVDKDANKVDSINNRRVPFNDSELADQLKNSSLEATTDFKKIIGSSIVVVCVPTPVSQNNLPNLEPLESACQGIGSFLHKGQLIIIESTVNPGVCESVVLPILEKNSGLKGGKDFCLAHCPERINPRDKHWTVENISRIVGALENKGLYRAMRFYKSLINGQIKSMGSIKEAEAVKIVENSFRDVNIAFANELAMSFSKIGVDINNVIEGAATKPFAFMAHYPGCGVGGHCIPVDPYYLINGAKNVGFNHEFLLLARHINEKMPEFTVQLLKNALAEKNIELKNARIAVLGLAYKPEIDDCRESPSFKIIELLEKNGANVISFDPFVLSRSSAHSLEDALSGSQAAIIATAHDAFISLSPGYFLKNGIDVVIDGRNCLPKNKFIETGIMYRGIGR